MTDHLGSGRNLVDNNGIVHKQVVYDSFGKRSGEVNRDAAGTVLPALSASAVDTAFGYTGADWDGDVGLINHDARWYDSGTGRWLSQDPISFEAGDPNLYRYVGNTPTTKTDPSGLDWRDDYWESAFGDDSWFAGLGNGIRGIGAALDPRTIPGDLRNAFTELPNDWEKATRLWDAPDDYCAERYHVISHGVAEQFSTPRGAGEAYAFIAALAVARKFPSFPSVPGSTPPLYVYGRWPFSGPELIGRGGGRPFASAHPPGPWSTSWNALYVGQRFLRTGHVRPRPNVYPLSEAEAANFVPVSRFTPTGFFFKHNAGQYCTRSPGNMTFGTGQMVPPATQQVFRYYLNQSGEWIIIGGGTYAGIELFDNE